MGERVAALDYASSRFSGGEVTGFNNVARYESADLATFLDTEHWRTRVGGGYEVHEVDYFVELLYFNSPA